MNGRWIALLLAAALLAPAASRAQGIELKFASFPPPPGALNQDVLGPWVKEVNEALKGTD